MEAADYKMAWTLYLGAGLCFTLLLWYFSRKHIQRDLAFLLQGIAVALIFTPWYVYPDQDYLAPALMVFMMDTITLSPEEGIRGLIPLIMALLLALLVSIGRSVFSRVAARRRLRAAEDAEEQD